MSISIVVINKTRGLGGWGGKSLFTLHFAHEFGNACTHTVIFTAARSRTDLGLIRHLQDLLLNRTSCPLRKINNSLGIFNLNILENKPIKYQGKVKKEKAHTTQDGKPDSKTEKMMIGWKGRWNMRLLCRLY